MPTCTAHMPTMGLMPPFAIHAWKMLIRLL